MVPDTRLIAAWRAGSADGDFDHRKKKKIEPKTTIMGKVAVASIMVVYSIEVLGLILGTLPRQLKNSVEYIVAAVIVASIGDKAISFASSLREAKLERRIPDGTDKKRT